jgi:hypothetical protein
MPNSLPNFKGIPLPIGIIFSDVFQNVSNQVLEIDQTLVPPGHLWSRLLANRVLIGDAYTDRGYITQVLIRQGLIAMAAYTPVFPPNFFYLQSYESNTWFVINAVEVDLSTEYPEETEEIAWDATDVTGPPAGSVINFDIIVNFGNWFILQLDSEDAVGMQIDTRTGTPTDFIETGSPTFLYQKRLIQNFPFLTIPLGVPNTQKLIFQAEDGNPYLLRINDAGQLFWTRYIGVTSSSLFESTGVFWSVTTPILNSITTNKSFNFTDSSGDLVDGSFSGTYAGPYSGNIQFQFRDTDVADLEPGTFSISSTNGPWSVNGTLTISSDA